MNIIVLTEIPEKELVAHYRCPKCDHQFDVEEDNPSCPSCGCEDVLLIEDEI